jgi:hypothetical protein
MEWITDPITGERDADLTYEEAGKLLNISPRTLREHAWDPEFPVIVYNAHCHRVRWTRLQRWIDAHLVGQRHAAKTEATADAT